MTTVAFVGLGIMGAPMGIVTAAARDAGVAIPLGGHVAGLVAALNAQGHGRLDHGALLLVDQLSGRGDAPDRDRA